MGSSSIRTAFGSRAYSDAMDSAWREIRSHLTQGLPVPWCVQRARAMYRQAWRNECNRARGRAAE